MPIFVFGIEKNLFTVAVPNFYIIGMCGLHIPNNYACQVIPLQFGSLLTFLYTPPDLMVFFHSFTSTLFSRDNGPGLSLQ